jgi:hypothetical protein
VSAQKVVEGGGIAFSLSDSLVGMDASRVPSPGLAPAGLCPYAAHNFFWCFRENLLHHEIVPNL